MKQKIYFLGAALFVCSALWSMEDDRSVTVECSENFTIMARYGEICIRDHQAKKDISLSTTGLIEEKEDLSIAIASDEGSFCVAGAQKFRQYALKHWALKPGALMLQQSLAMIKTVNVMSITNEVRVKGIAACKDGANYNFVMKIYVADADIVFCALKNYAKHARRHIEALKDMAPKPGINPVAGCQKYLYVQHYTKMERFKKEIAATSLKPEVADTIDRLIASTEKPDDIAIARAVHKKYYPFK